MVIDYIFHHLLNIALTVAASQAVTDAVILKVVFVVSLKEPFAMDVITADFMDNVCLTQSLDIVDDGRRGDFLALPSHKL